MPQSNLLEMPVNHIQHRVAVGNFNNSNRLNLSKNNCFIGQTFGVHKNKTILFLLYIFLFGVCVPCKSVRYFFFNALLILSIAISLRFCFVSILLLLCGDVEVNPGPRYNDKASFSICHWNLNSLISHNYAKVFLLKAYLAIYKFDIICLSETYLDSSISVDENLEIEGYQLVRSDHPSNTRRGGVCIYHRDYLPLRVININYLNE